MNKITFDLLLVEITLSEYTVIELFTNYNNIDLLYPNMPFKILKKFKLEVEW